MAEFSDVGVYTVYTMFLLTNCEVHTAKYSDNSFNIRTERNDVLQKTMVRLLSVWTSQLVNESFIVQPDEHCKKLFVRLSENVWKANKIYSKTIL